MSKFCVKPLVSVHIIVTLIRFFSYLVYDIPIVLPLITAI